MNKYLLFIFLICIESCVYIKVTDGLKEEAKLSDSQEFDGHYFFLDIEPKDNKTFFLPFFIIDKYYGSSLISFRYQQPENGPYRKMIINEFIIKNVDDEIIVDLLKEIKKDKIELTIGELDNRFCEYSFNKEFVLEVIQKLLD